MIQRVSSGAVRKALSSILCSSVSARAKTCVPPYICNRAGPKQRKMTLPYSKVVTARAYTNYTLTLLLNKPSKRDIHLIVLKAVCALLMLYYSIENRLLFALLISPKYLNSSTFLRGCPLHLKTTSILICIAFILVTFI